MLKNLPNVRPKAPRVTTASCVHRVSLQTDHRLGVMPNARKDKQKLKSIFNFKHSRDFSVPWHHQHKQSSVIHTIALGKSRKQQKVFRWVNLQDLYNTEPHWWLHKHEAECNSKHQRETGEEKFLVLAKKWDEQDELSRKPQRGCQSNYLHVFPVLRGGKLHLKQQKSFEGSKKIHQSFINPWAWQFYEFVSNDLQSVGSHA